MPRSTALITGGSGYFGSLLVRKLLERGYECRVFDLNDADDRPADVGFVRGDIRDPAAVRSACEGMQLVFHNVAQVPLAKDREAFWSVNCGGTENLLDAARATGVAKIVDATQAAKDEAAEKEAEMLADYEASKRGEKPKAP